MKNNKNITLLKQVSEGFCSSLGEVRGIARLEKQGEKYLIKLCFLNLATLKNGEYFLFFQGENQSAVQLFNVEGEEFILSEEIYAVTLFFKDGNTLLTVLSGQFFKWKELKEIEEDAKNFFETESKNTQKNRFLSEEKEGEFYDDEAVATVNYYQFSGEKQDEEFSNSAIFSDENSSDSGEKEEGGDKGEERLYDNAKDDGEEYYQKIKSQLQKVFDENPKEENLSEMVTESKWVKISEKGKSFVVGIIEEKGKPKYVCYGIPGVYGRKPEEISGFATFIPTSPFALKGEGYWVMYQDAISGKSIE